MNKTFKEYRAQKNKLPPIETVFGTHSKKKESLPSIETVFGSHSLGKEKKPEKAQIQEELGDHLNSTSAQKHIHDVSAPLDDSKLSPHELSSVVDYTDDSSMLNGMLHHKYAGHNASNAYAGLAHHLTSALDKHKTSNAFHVFTGVRTSPAKYFKPNDQSEHTEVHLPAFTSTSTSFTKAKEFSEKTSHYNDPHHGIIEHIVKHIIKIHLPEGTSAASMTQHSFVPGEKEVLLNRGHNIKLNRTPEMVAPSTYMWHAEVTGHAPTDITKE